MSSLSPPAIIHRSSITCKDGGVEDVTVLDTKAQDHNVKTLIDIAKLYKDGNISKIDVEHRVQVILQSLSGHSSAVLAFSRQLKRFEKTCNMHFCGFWTECKSSCQYKGSKSAWKRDVIDIYTPLDTMTIPSRSSSTTSLTHVWMEQLEKTRSALDMAGTASNPHSSGGSVMGADEEMEEKDFDVLLLEAKLERTQHELHEAKVELAKVQKLLDIPTTIPNYVADSITEAELKEIKRLQALEHKWIPSYLTTDLSTLSEEEQRERLQMLETPYIPSVPVLEGLKLNDVEVVVGGVPEHFNYPWHMAINEGLFAKAGLKVRFVEVPGGTGEMMRMLRANEIDIAVALTEGIVANIANDTQQPSDVAIIGTYVSSPLTWGISVDGKSPYTTVSDLYNSKIGISRFGSGSHLMSFLLAEQQGWKIKPEGAPAGTDGIEFVVKSNIHKMVESLHDGSSDVFLWETFMTKPYYDSGELRKVGEIVTPWPCFMAASRRTYLSKDDLMVTRVTQVMNVVRHACGLFKADKATSIPKVAAKHNLKVNDASAWFSRVAYPTDACISEKILQDTTNALKRLGLIKGAMSCANLVDDRVGKLVVNTADPEVSLASKTALPTAELVRVPYSNAPAPERPMSARASARKLALSLVKEHLSR